MTTYSGVIAKNDLVATKINRRTVYRSNFILLTLIILLAVAYVFLANLYVAQKYSLNLRKNELSTLNAQIVFQGQNSADLDREALLLFAHKYNMVEVKDSDSIVQERNFAVETTLLR